MPYMVVATSDSYAHITEPSSATFAAVGDSSSVHSRVQPDTRDLVEQLLFTVPDFSWTLEIDLLGRHRITIHFKGAEVGIDE